MSLFPEENILTKEIESWRGFANGLKSEEDKKMFLKMLEGCQKYALAINAKGRPFTSETFDHGSFIRTTQNDKLVAKENTDAKKQ
jgi:hypothetical protein